jgi:hypothetical protein
MVMIASNKLSDTKTTPEDADDDSEFPKPDKLLSAFQRRERRAEQKGSYSNADLSLERTPEQLDRQTQSDNSAVSCQPVAGDNHGTCKKTSKSSADRHLTTCRPSDCD